MRPRPSPCPQVGDAEERPPGPGLADAAGEEAALAAAARLLPALPHHGDQPQGAGFRAPAWPQGVSGARGAERSRWAGPVSSAGAREPAPSGPHLRVRAAPGRQGQHAEDLQQHPRVSDMQGERRRACCRAGVQGCTAVWAPSRGQGLWVGGGGRGRNFASQDFPGGPVAKSLHFFCRGPGPSPWSES